MGMYNEFAVLCSHDSSAVCIQECITSRHGPGLMVRSTTALLPVAADVELVLGPLLDRPRSITLQTPTPRRARVMSPTA